MAILTYNDNNFLLDGKPYTIISGAMHYFRIPREYWLDRLTKLKECGFNTVETYTCWNAHEPREGEFDFSGMLDIEEYVKLAESIGLNVIVRPGPYICSEREFGGLPAWLLTYEKVALRCYEPVFIEKVRRYYKELFKYLTPHLSTNGGGIIMVQIENEYGSYGNDKQYLQAVVDIYRECGVDCTLFTSDGPCATMLSGGSLPEHLAVANFGSNPKSAFATLKKLRPNQPCMCGEYWCGWFDHWYEEHHVREADEVAGLFRDMIDSGASLNFYMFHGGTNFGFMNGANYHDKYAPTVTSYDYNALLSEAGDLTPAYHAVRKMIEDYTKTELPPLTVKNSEKKAYGKLALTESASLFDLLGEVYPAVHTAAPKYMEDIGQSYGYTVYRTTVVGPKDESTLNFEAVHDRAVVYIDGKKVGTIERGAKADTITMPKLEDGETLELTIVNENMGRVNYGPKLRDRKGVVGIRLGYQHQYGWDMYAVEDTDKLAEIAYSECSGGVDGMTVLRGNLKIDGKPCDTFVKLDGFHHGIVIVNGFNLGRYYNDAGPQKTLYVPAPMLREGDNSVIVFETDGSDTNVIEFVDVPELG